MTGIPPESKVLVKNDARRVDYVARVERSPPRALPLWWPAIILTA
jgi:hypothetical protein